MKTLLTLLALVFVTTNTRAGSATWNLNPTSNDWNTATNWTPATVPNGPSDVATFSTSRHPHVTISDETEVNSIVFSAGADAFTIVGDVFNELTISGAGVLNNSAVTQTIAAAAGSGAPADRNKLPAFEEISFLNNATAGSNVAYPVTAAFGELGVGGNIIFYDSTTADHAAFEIFGSVGRSTVSEVEFHDSSTAGNATIIVHRNGILEVHDSASFGQAVITSDNGGVVTVFHGASAGNALISNTGKITFSGSDGQLTTADMAIITNESPIDKTGAGTTYFGSWTTAGDAAIICNGGGRSEKNGCSVTFSGEGATAGSATLIANSGTDGGAGGAIIFLPSSDGGTADCEVFGNGNLDISQHDSSVTIGSLMGDGLVFLGARNLTVGANDISTLLTGVIQDGGIGGGVGGSLTKMGAGTLILGSANTYTGGTTVNGGFLFVNNSSGSGTGSGRVQVMGGTLGGSGAIDGSVMVGTGGGAGASLGPGQNSATPGTLTIGRSLIFQRDATYKVTLNSAEMTADKVSAQGVRIRLAQLSMTDLGTAVLSPGTVFTIVENTSASSIRGSFSNLTDGGTVTVGNNTFQADYESGDGNDLTLTVIQ